MNRVMMVEGQHEKLYLEDYIKNHGKLLVSLDRDIMVENPNRLDAVVKVYGADYDIIYVISDDDVLAVAKKREDAIETARINDIKLNIYLQDPEFDTFCAAHFEEYEIDENLSQSDIKISARKFLSKFNSKNNKKWTLTEIKKYGGALKNTKRYKSRFQIIQILG